MCGITGIFNLKSSNNASILIRKMTDTLAHRGPDSDGFYLDAHIALGHRRLSIIDLSTSANQPFTDHSNRYVLVFNGEIYNYQEVKRLIPEYPFKTTSDTEVILAAYIKWGKDCLQYLNGMFAFAIWDKKEQQLFVVRDRLGVKPFYYYFDGQLFVFASEIRSLLSSGLMPRRLDRYALRDYLVFQTVHAPYTIIKDIFQLMPGEYAFISAKGIQKSYYWTLENPTQHFEIPDALTARKKVKELLTASVQRRMISDVPLGAFLSGGIDSSAIVGLMSEVSERPIDTFTITFAEKEYDESHYANLVAKKFKTHHTEIRLTPKDFLKALPEALDTVDAPSGDGLNTYMVSKWTKEAGITVALSGIGGDELFAGYPYFNYFKKIHSNPYWKIPAAVRKPIANLACQFLPNRPKYERIAPILKADEPSIAEIYPLFRGIQTQAAAEKLLGNQDKAPLIIKQLLSERKTAIAKLPLMSQVTVAELLSYTLNVLMRDADQFSMASALELRAPFFDFKLVEYVLQVPDAFKYDPNSLKNLLVTALQPLLPETIVQRPKMGFSFPWEQWLLTDLRSFCQDQLTYLAQQPFINKMVLWQDWTTFLNSRGKKVSWVKMWQLVVLAYWLREHKIEVFDEKI